MSDAVVLKEIAKRYKDVTAVKSASLSATKGEVFGLLGPSGSGKSTLLRIIDLLEAPDSGEIEINGENVHTDSKEAFQARRRIGMVLQKPVVLNRSVENNLAYALNIRGWSEKETQKRVDWELKRLGLEERREKNARTLSGGEMQRLCFARSTIFDPDLLLLDEFTANLDPANVALLEDMVRSYASENKNRAVIVVTHNLFQAKRMCHRIALMWDGRIVEVADRKRFFENPEDERTAAFVSGELVY
jgi:tungstate transport system ATP-binding protein